MYMCVCICMYVHARYACNVCGGQMRASDLPAAGVIERCESPCGFLEPNPYPLQEQPVF